MDRFRNAEGMAHTSKLVSVGAGSTEKVLQDFGKDLSATQNELRTANAKAKSQRRSARRAAKQARQYEQEHRVASWDITKSGNPWQVQDKSLRIFTDEVRLNTVEGDYREPIRTVHGCVTTEPQGIHPDFKRVLAPPPGQQEWSNKDYTNPLKGHRDPRTETFNDVNGDPRVTTDLTKTLPTEFLSSMPGKMRALDRRAQSVESGVRGRNRAAFIAKTRFFVAPDAYSIEDGGYCSQRFPQAHPPTKPWREELEETNSPLGRWQRGNEHPRVFSDTGQSLNSTTPYYSWRESAAACDPRRSLTDRARHSVYAADQAVDDASTTRGLSHTVRPPPLPPLPRAAPAFGLGRLPWHRFRTMASHLTCLLCAQVRQQRNASNTFRLSSRSLTLSLPEEEVPKQFKLTHRARCSVKDTTGDSRKFLRDELVDPMRDERELKFVGARQSGVIGRERHVPARALSARAAQKQR